MRKRRGVRGLALAIINVVVILAAALIVQSRGAGDVAPSNGSFALPAEQDLAPLGTLDSRPALTPRVSSSSAAAPSKSAGGQDTSGTVVPPVARQSEDSSATSDVASEPVWYEQTYAAVAPFVTASDNPLPKAGASLGGYASSASPTYGRRSSSGGGYGGGGASGGAASSGGGSRSTAQNATTNSASSAALRSPTADPAFAAADVPTLLPTQAQGTPLFGGGAASGGFSFPLLQFPGAGSAITMGAMLPNVGEGSSDGSTASVTQLQQPVSVPEPTTLLLLGSGLAFAAYRRQRLMRRF